MRIDAYNQIAQIYGVNKTSQTTRTQTASVRDELTISRAGQDYRIAKQAVAQSPDVREDKVADIKSRIEAGTYDVSPDDFASKLLEKYQAAFA